MSHSLEIATGPESGSSNHIGLFCALRPHGPGPKCDLIRTLSPATTSPFNTSETINSASSTTCLGASGIAVCLVASNLATTTTRASSNARWICTSSAPASGRHEHASDRPIAPIRISAAPRICRLVLMAYNAMFEPRVALNASARNICWAVDPSQQRNSQGALEITHEEIALTIPSWYK